MPIPQDNLAYAMLLSINEGRSLGSGFRIKFNDMSYLITAKHVLYDRNNELYGETLVLTGYTPIGPERLPLILNIDLSDTPILRSDDYDIAAILLGRHEQIPDQNYDTPLRNLQGPMKRPTRLAMEEWVTCVERGQGALVSVDQEAIGNLDSVSIGNDVYLLGYPTSLGLQNNQYYDFSRPLARKGIVAGIDENRSTFVIDCPAYPGNSGGPVVEHCSDSLYRVTGMVSKYIPYETQWHSNRGDVINTDISNSGYTVCISMDRILGLLEEQQSLAST